MILALALYILWGGVVWRLRGGAFHMATGINIGTQATRLACGVLLAAPLAPLDPRALLFAPAIFVGLTLVGWGPYMGLGHSTSDRAPGVMDPILRLRWQTETFWSDFVGLSLCGVLCLLPAMPVAVLTHPIAVPCLAGAGALFGLIYWLAYRLCLPTLGVWVDDRTVWGEVGCGMVVAAALWAAR